MEGMQLNQIMSAMFTITYDPDTAVNGVEFFVAKFENFIKMMNINSEEVILFLFNHCLQGRALVEHDAYLSANKKVNFEKCKANLFLKFKPQHAQILQEFDNLYGVEDREELLRRLLSTINQLESKSRPDFPIFLAYYLLEMNPQLKVIAVEEYSKIIKDKEKQLNVVEFGKKLNTYLENKKKLHIDPIMPGSSYDNPVLVNRIEKEGKRKPIRCFNCGKLGHIARKCRSAKEVNVVMSEKARKLTTELKIGNKMVEALVDTGAEINTMNEEMVDSLGLRNNVIKKEKRLFGPDNSRILCRGELRIALQTNDGSKTVEFCIVEGFNNQVILGIKSILELGLLDLSQAVRINNIHETQELWKKFPEVVEHSRKDYGMKVQGERIIVLEKQFKSMRRPYGYNEIMLNKIDEEVEALLESGIVEPSKAVDVSPVVMVKKKDNSFRMCIDFRKLNQVTKRMQATFLNPESVQETVKGKSWFSKIDLKEGYWQINIHPEDAIFSAFVTRKGIFQFRKLPFGLKNAPILFQNLMKKILEGLQNIIYFLDDILIFSNSEEEHLNHTQQVLERLDKYNVKVNKAKCVLNVKKIEFLGNVYDGVKVYPDATKIAKVANIQAPVNIKGVRSILGFFNYFARFISGYASKAEPLFELLRGDKQFCWAEKHQQALEMLKTDLQQISNLHNIDYTKDVFIQTDASDVAVGSIIFQLEKGERKIIQYFSKSLNSAQRNYATTDKEALAIIETLKKFKFLLFGMKLCFQVDHKPLQQFFNNKNFTGRRLRWTLELQEFDYQINYIGAESNDTADLLSRINSIAAEVSDINKCQIIGEYHTEFHFGIGKTFADLRRNYKWKNMYQDVVTYVKACTKCQRKHHNDYERKQGKLESIVTEQPHQLLVMDILGPLRRAGKYSYILVLMDHFSKFSCFVALKDTTTATIIRKVENRYIRNFGPPKSILSDNGPQFKSKEFKNFCFKYSIKKIFTSPYHPQCNGLVERQNRTVKNFLRSAILPSHQNWSQLLGNLQLKYNSSIHTTTKFSPSEIMLHKEPQTIKGGQFHGYSIMEKRAEVIKHQHQVNMRNERNYNKDKREVRFGVNEKVHVKSFNALKEQSRKFANPWVPGTIMCQIRPKVYLVKSEGREQIINVDRLRKIEGDRLENFRKLLSATNSVAVPLEVSVAINTPVPIKAEIITTATIKSEECVTPKRNVGTPRKNAVTPVKIRSPFKMNHPNIMKQAQMKELLVSLGYDISKAKMADIRNLYEKIYREARSKSKGGIM